MYIARRRRSLSQQERKNTFVMVVNNITNIWNIRTLEPWNINGTLEPCMDLILLYRILFELEKKGFYLNIFD